MKKQGISQEMLKLIACVTMLIDHAGATVVFSMYEAAWYAGDAAAVNLLALAYYVMRLIGRIAFPIYCFLLVEGAHYTRNPKKYALRLAVGMVLSEIPFDLAFFGGPDWRNSSVMVTLLLGYLMLVGMDTLPGGWKLLAIPPFYGLAEWLGTDYGGHGILIIAMLYLTRELPNAKLWQTLCLAVLLWFGATIRIGPVEVPLEIFGLLALIPIFRYSGRKQTGSKAVQWAFYLFYPVHILVLWIITKLIFT